MSEPQVGKARAALLGGVEEIADFLSAFIVPDVCSVVDLTGEVHEFSPVISARRVLHATLAINKILSSKQADGLAEKIERTSEEQGRVAAVQSLLLAGLEDPANQDHIHALFEIVQPAVLRQARAAAAKAELTAIDGEAAMHVLDLFEIDQIVEALIPFLSRIGTRLAVTVRTTMGIEPKASPRSSRPVRSLPSVS